MHTVNQIIDPASPSRPNGLDGTTRRLLAGHASEEQPCKEGKVSETSALPLQRKGRNTSLEALDNTIQAFNESAVFQSRDLRFTIEKDTGSHIVKVINTRTNETIRQIPPENLLALRRQLKDALEQLRKPIGLLVDAEV